MDARVCACNSTPQSDRPQEYSTAKPKILQTGIISYGDPVNRTIKSGPCKKKKKGGPAHTYHTTSQPLITAVTAAVTAAVQAARECSQALAQTEEDAGAAHVEAA